MDRKPMVGAQVVPFYKRNNAIDEGCGQNGTFEAKREISAPPAPKRRAGPIADAIRNVEALCRNPDITPAARDAAGRVLQDLSALDVNTGAARDAMRRIAAESFAKLEAELSGEAQ